MGLVLALASSAVFAQMANPDEVEVRVVPLEANLNVLMGVGGNIAVSSGSDGVFIIDDDLKPMAAKISAAIATLSDKPVRIVFNTHWHFDHAGGNEFFGDAGATIVAHDNVRARMNTEQKSAFFKSVTPPAPAIALPVITFDNTATFHLNGHTIKAMHVPPAHTDGDSILFFEEVNVVHLGYVFFNRMYPFIDIDSGGSITGVIAALDLIIPMLNDQTRIIPGHGPIGSLADLKAYRATLATVSARMRTLIEAGKSREEVVALKPTEEFDKVWSWSFMPPERWTGLIYDSLVASGIKPGG
jgi:glyoxylase-like metal-dependent hydrolase (beta-lactamase superfamily II)